MKKTGIRIFLSLILAALLIICSVSTAMAGKPVKTEEIVLTGWESGDITFNYSWSGWGAWGVRVYAYQYNATTHAYIRIFNSELYPTPNGKRVTNFAGTQSIAYDDSGTYEWQLWMFLVKKNGNFIRQGGAYAQAYSGKFII